MKQFLLMRIKLSPSVQNPSRVHKNNAGWKRTDRNCRIYTWTFPVQRDPSAGSWICRQKHSGNELLLEVDFLVGKKQLKQILEKVINTHGATKTAEVLDCYQSNGL